MQKIAFIFDKENSLHHYLTFAEIGFEPNVAMLNHFYGQGRWVYLPAEQLPTEISLYTIIDGALAKK